MIRDKTTGKVISERHSVCRSLWSKARGLMFRFRPVCLVFEFSKLQRNSLHMWFVFFPIDVLFLDGDRKVVEIKERFMPFAFYTPKKKSMFVIELPVLTVEDRGISVGDAIEWN